MAGFRILLAVLLAASMCFSAWQETLEVHVVDNKGRPLKGAVVEVSYQKSAFPVTEKTLDGYFSITVGESGKATVSFSNVVQNPEFELRYYIVKATYGDSSKSEKVTCSSLGDRCHHSTPYLRSFFMDAYRANVRVEDQNGDPIEGAEVSFGEQKIETGADGVAWFSVLNNKNYNIVVEFAGKRRTLSGKISGADADLSALIPRYDVYLRVIDDEGGALSADVLLQGESKSTDDRGYVRFDNLVSDNVEVFVRHATGFRIFNITLTGDLERDIVIDERPPEITQVSRSVDKGQKAVFISANVRDPGVKGSGLRDIDPVRLRYKIGAEGWKSVAMYQTGRDAFQGSIPLAYDVEINYEIEAYDAQGNGGSHTGKFVLEEGEAPPQNGEPPVVIDDGPEEPKERQEGIDIITLVAGVLIFIVVLLIIYKKYTGEF